MLLILKLPGVSFIRRARSALPSLISLAFSSDPAVIRGLTWKPVPCRDSTSDRHLLSEK
jgi:hypothetical protein